MALYDVDTVDAALEHVKADVEIAAVTCGPKGSLVVHDGDVIEIPAHPADRVVDTTGAGDLYAAGFLYGYTAGGRWRLRAPRVDGGHGGARSHRAEAGSVARPDGVVLRSRVRAPRRRLGSRGRCVGRRRRAAIAESAPEVGAARRAGRARLRVDAGGGPLRRHHRRGADRGAAGVPGGRGGRPRRRAAVRGGRTVDGASSPSSDASTPTRATTCRWSCTRCVPPCAPGAAPSSSPTRPAGSGPGCAWASPC